MSAKDFVPSYMVVCGPPDKKNAGSTAYFWLREILLIDTVRNPDKGWYTYIHKLPECAAGATPEDTLMMLIEEIRKDVSFDVDWPKAVFLGALATDRNLTDKKSQLFVYSATQEEWDKMCELSARNSNIHTPTIHSIFTDNLLDWAQMGMLLTAMQTA